MSKLAAVKGPLAGHSFTLSKVSTIGRGMEATIRLDEITVSREHARLIQDESRGVILEDLRSGNGTFVNGVKVTSARLQDGDTVAIGESVLTFQSEDADVKARVQRMATLTLEAQDSDSSTMKTLDVEAAHARHNISDDSAISELNVTNRSLQILNELFRSFGTKLDKAELLDEIVDTLFEVFPRTHRAFIIMRDADTGELAPCGVRVRGPESDTQLSMSKTILEVVMDQKLAVWAKDAMSDGRFRESESIVNMQMRSVMCAPLMTEAEVFGFVTLDTQEISPNYNEDGLALLVGIANQASLAIANARMHAELLTQERVNQDLQNASRIQHSFLPQNPPLVPGYEFADWYCAALEVGGDFYDFINMPDGKLGVVVGDVSGKGIPAALMMAKTASLVRFEAATGRSPGAIMKAINKSMAETETKLFVTVLLMSVDCEANAVVMANAGHPLPVLRRGDGTVEAITFESGFPVGLMDDAEFPEYSMRIEPGDRLCLFTDGVTEAMNAAQEQYGETRLVSAVEGATANAYEIVQAIQKSIARHVDGASQSDDLTLVCFGPYDGAEPELVLLAAEESQSLDA